jgi:hypothetical protein
MAGANPVGKDLKTLFHDPAAAEGDHGESWVEMQRSRSGQNHGKRHAGANKL